MRGTHGCTHSGGGEKTNRIDTHRAREHLSEDTERTCIIASE